MIVDLVMAHGGGSHGGNNGRNCNNRGKMNRNNNKKLFAMLDSLDRNQIDDSISPFNLSNGDHLGWSLVPITC